ncbi:MAG: LysR substrate-binding domain-containing protein [Halofilum sp. (in: g-proteobacteria)]|nr:LysR substrate-binding domain-containing protein [Halofilum sp. (in: g-proteobacteria)]
MRLDTESLRALKLVAEVGGVTEAAARLSLTQSAVSWKLRRLEERVGRTLLRREGRTLQPTRQGRELLEFADRILSAHDAAVQRFRGSALSGSIRLGATDDVAVNRVAGIAGRFRWAHPAIRLQIRVESSLRVAEWVDAGEVDLAVMPVEHHEVRAGDFVLWQDQLRFVQATDVEFSADDPLPLVTFGSQCFYGRVAGALLDAAGIPYEEVLQSASIAGVRAAVSAGFGVALMNRGFMTEDQCTWSGAAAIATPPDIHYVLRAAEGPLTDAQQTLVGELRGSVPPE